MVMEIKILSRFISGPMVKFQSNAIWTIVRWPGIVCGFILAAEYWPAKIKTLFARTGRFVEWPSTFPPPFREVVDHTWLSGRPGLLAGLVFTTSLQLRDSAGLAPASP
jgi:hypothetical protein